LRQQRKDSAAEMANSVRGGPARPPLYRFPGAQAFAGVSTNLTERGMASHRFVDSSGRRDKLLDAGTW